jgi:argininosuccinate lyase
MAMWGGRFDAPPNELVAKMGESVSYDQRMYPQDIRGSTVHAQMLARQGIISEEDATAIVDGLAAVKAEIDGGKFEFKTALEDVHMNIEARLTEIVGPVGGKLHSGRSRNDQVATDVRLHLRDESDVILQEIKSLQASLVHLAAAHTDTILPGFTHLQHAQPVILAHYLLAYTEMLDRDLSRIRDWRARMNYLPLGAGALAGCTLPLDRVWVAKELGFAGVLNNSMDAVADRDFAIELVSALSVLMMHMSRMSEDIIFWMSQEAGWVELGDDFCTGSSLMPQKKNPDMCELTRGKASRVYGDLVTLLSMMKGLPLSYNRDMQEDKEPIFDAIDTVKLVLAVYAPMIASMRVNKERMLAAASDPALMATDLAEWLVQNSVPFRDAHHRVGRLVGYSRKVNTPLDKLTLDQIKESVPEANEEVLALWKPEKSVAARDIIGATAPKQVRFQLQTRWAHLLTEKISE